jgi:hypothetical protein
MTQAVLTIVRPEESGMAASTVNTSRELGGVFGVAVLGSVVNAALIGGLTHKMVALHVPAVWRQVAINIITTGGNISAAEKSFPTHGHLSLIAKVLLAAEASAGHGIHLALQIGAAIVLAAGLVAGFAARHKVRA